MAMGQPIKYVRDAAPHFCITMCMLAGTWIPWQSCHLNQHMMHIAYAGLEPATPVFSDGALPSELIGVLLHPSAFATHSSRSTVHVLQV